MLLIVKLPIKHEVAQGGTTQALIEVVNAATHEPAATKGDNATRKRPRNSRAPGRGQAFPDRNQAVSAIDLLRIEGNIDRRG